MYVLCRCPSHPPAAMQYLTPGMSLGEALGLLDLLSPSVVAARRAMQAGRAVDTTALYRKLNSLLALLQCTLLWLLMLLLCLMLCLSLLMLSLAVLVWLVLLLLLLLPDCLFECLCGVHSVRCGERLAWSRVCGRVRTAQVDSQLLGGGEWLNFLILH